MYYVQENARETTFINTLCTSSLIEARPIVGGFHSIRDMVHNVVSLSSPISSLQKVRLYKTQHKKESIESKYFGSCLCNYMSFKQPENGYQTDPKVVNFISKFGQTYCDMHSFPCFPNRARVVGSLRTWKASPSAFVQTITRKNEHHKIMLNPRSYQT